jgi:predicted enzyme related to lactoylglutathione lyase
MVLSLFRIDIFSRQPYVLRDFYEQVLDLKLDYTNADSSSFEFAIGNMKLVISKSATEVKNKIRICLCTTEYKSYRLALAAKNIAITPTKVKEGRFFFELKDPDGNEVAVYQL